MVVAEPVKVKLPEVSITNLSVPASLTKKAPVEEAVKVLPEDIRVELADWMVRVEAEPVVFQVEAAAPVRLRELVAVMLSVLITIVFPMVAVAT